MLYRKIEKTIEEHLVADENGNFYISERLKSYLGESDIDININKLIPENDYEKGRLKGVSERVEARERERFIERASKNANKENRENEKQDEEIQKIAEKQEIEAKQAEAEALTKATDEEMFGYFREHFNELGAECKTKIQQIMLSNGVDDITKLLSNHEALVAIYDLIK